MAYKKFIKLADLSTEVTDQLGGEGVAAGKPTVTNVLTTGTAMVGEDLTVVFDFVDAEGDAEGVHTFQWYRADNTSGLNSAPIAAATSDSYPLQNADIGKYIRCAITPKALTGTLVGNETFSPYSAVIVAAGAVETNAVWNATGSNNATIVANAVTATSTVAELKCNTSSVITPANGVEAYFEFRNNGEWDGLQALLMPSSGAPHTLSGGVTAGSVAHLDFATGDMNYGIAGTYIDTLGAIADGALVRIGFNGTGTLEVFVDDVEQTLPNSVVSAVPCVLYVFAYDDLVGGGNRGLTQVKFST